MKICFFHLRERGHFKKGTRSQGVILIEFLVAILIIALIILGGGMFFFYGRVYIVREAHRRAAVLVASQRVEELKAADWDEIALNSPSYEVYYITHSSVWVINPSEAKDTGVLVDNLSSGEMLTEAQWKDDNPGDGNPTYDYLRVTVTLEWTDSAANSVSLTSLIAPP